MPWDTWLADVSAHWQVASLRLTVFPAPGAPGAPLSWLELTGEEPDERQQQPKNRTTIEVGRIAIGDHSRSVRIVTTPFQTDLHIAEAAVSVESEESQAGKPELMAPDEGLAALRQLAAKWFGLERPTTRIAFGAVLRRNAANKPDAYLALSDYLPFPLDTGSSDLVYQINRPRTSRVFPDLEINRLNHWVVVTTRMVQLSAIAAPSSAAEPLTVSIDVQLTLDINNAPPDEQLEVSRVSPLFDELVELGLEIAAQGDQP